MKKPSSIIAKWNNRSIQSKLILIFSIALVFIMGVNIVMFININTMMGSLERIYVSNLNLDELLVSMGDVHNSMTEYLDTKSSDSLDKYYRADQSYRRSLETLNTATVDDDMLMAEKNIYNLSITYLDIVEDTINAKRGRDVEKYSEYYEAACEKYGVVETFVYSLNNARFRSNNRDYNVLLTSLRYIETVNAIVLLLAALITIGLVSAVTGNIIRPLIDLSDAAKQVSEGDFDVEVTPLNRNDEIGILSATFAQMLTSIREYVARLGESIRNESALKERELKMETQIKDAQLKYLQAQINPHFLFNTLNAGAQLAMLEGAEKTTVFIDNMASFFRYNIRKLDEDTTIGEELRLVDNYIYILNVRFSGEIHYHKNVDESLENVKVPSMILQPIVENAVNYGIRDIDREKIIEVTCVNAGDHYELTVWDNGKGMSAERIKEVLDGSYNPDAVSSGTGSNSNGIGIGNVCGRLELYFGESDLLDIKSDGEDAGTEVIIRIPALEDKGD
ncbi:MAG: histidine kinase [Lachnospiraceae bacterium]|nr:histidine kinase [Lachnospiraceae bacterium]